MKDVNVQRHVMDALVRGLNDGPDRRATIDRADIERVRQAAAIDGIDADEQRLLTALEHHDRIQVHCGTETLDFNPETIRFATAPAPTFTQQVRRTLADSA